MNPHAYKTIKDIVIRLASKYVLPKHLTEDDVLQDVLIKVYNNIHSLKDVNCFNVWVYNITKNYLNTLYTRDMEREFVEISEDITGSARDWYHTKNGYDNLVLKDIYNMIDRLPSGMRHMTVRHCIDAVSVKDLAKELGITESTVKSQLFKGRKHLNRMLGPL